MTHEIAQLVRDLAVAGVVYLAYRTALRASKSSGRISTLWRGWAWCAGIAAFAAFSLGSPSCTDSDPMFGGCSEYADDGYTPSNESRGLRFLYVALLLGVPVTMGALAAQGDPLNPWAAPNRKSP